MIKVATIAASCLLLVATSAAAAPTAINPLGAGSGNERCVTGTHCPGGGSYGGTASLLGIFESEIGKGPLSRIDDDYDAIWKATGSGTIAVRALARYAGDSSVLGLDAGSGYSALTEILANGKVRVADPEDYRADARRGDFSPLPANGGWHAIALAPAESFAFVLNDITMGYKLSSNPGMAGYANSGLTFLDYMVTWKVNDVVPHYLIAWEDRDPRNRSTTDHDYNDLLVEVLYAQPLLLPDAPALPVPEPATVALLLLGFPFLALIARRRG